MKTIKMRYTMRSLALAALLLMGGRANAIDLITKASQLTSNAYDPEYGTQAMLGHLLDGNVNTFWHSAWRGSDNPGGLHYLRVALSEPVKEGEIMNIRVAFRNTKIWRDFPCKFNVWVSADGDNWYKNCLWSVEYTGDGQYTTSPDIRLLHDARYVKLECTESYIPHDGHPYWSFALSELQITTEHATSVTGEGGGDPLTGKANYSDNLDGYDFMHARSILDVHNGNNASGNYQEWWRTNGYDENGKWSRDKELLDKLGVQMPDYSYFTHDTDSRITSGERQAAHIQEHTVYVLPGKPVLLQPYSDLNTCANYNENFIRWYDYGTDKASPNLAPTYEDWLLMQNEHGIFGGTSMTVNSYYDVNIRSVGEYNDFVTRVNNGEVTLNAMVTTNLNFNSVSVKPIGTQEHPYRGRFNGNGYTISNMKMKGGDRVGMFGNVAGGAIIKNVILDKTCSFSGTNYVAPIAGMFTLGYESQKLLVENFVFEGSCEASGTDAGGVFGTNLVSGRIEMACCLSAGSVKCTGSVTTAAGMAAWLGNTANSCVLKNSYCCATVSNTEKPFVRAPGAQIYSIVNCYDTNGSVKGENGNPVGGTYYPADVNRLDRRYWSQTTGKTYPMPNFQYDREGRYNGNNNRTLGTGTFFCVPAGEEVQEVTIAADISQMFEAKAANNLDRANKKMVEPVLMTRHLFNIKDGRKYAEEISGSPESNARYIQAHRREVYARAGADFQIRLDIPMPTPKTTATNIYYKASDGTYRNMSHWDMKVYDSNGNEVKDMFAGAADCPAVSIRTTGGRAEQDNHLTYDNIAQNASGSYYRILKCLAAKAKEGTYTVKLYACDEKNQIVKICGSDKPLEIAEYVVTFEPEEKASFVNAATLESDEKYHRHREGYLTAKYGEPQAKVDYDEYLKLEDPAGQANDYICNAGTGGIIGSTYSAGKAFLWPRQWENSSYGFGYNHRYDYAMYFVTNNSLCTPYSAAAQTVTSDENFGKGPCLRDRLFYNTKGEESGYFYYVNAASDPGVCATAHIDNICAGSTLYVSAWVSEFSKAAEVANLILNFQAHLRDGSTVTMHSFVTGYVQDQDRGRWVHVYYSFTPKLSEYGINSTDVKSYSVSLENNCISSSGADYAVDDIRVYVAKPSVFSRQIEPVCSEKIAPKTLVYASIDETLASNGLAEAATEAEGKKINLFYCFVDKHKYDEARDAGKDGRAAFNEAVLRYEYMPGGGDNQTFGRLSFNTHYASNPEYNEEYGPGEVAYRSVVDGDRCLCFNTFPKDEALRPGKEYYVAIYTEDENIQNPVTSPGADEFDIEDECSKTSVMRVRASSIVKIDGVTELDVDDIVVCENQQPTVQVDLLGKSTDGEGGLLEVEKNARLDWYVGSSDEFYGEHEGDIYLSEAILFFRESYPEAANLKVEPTGDFTEAMRQYLLSLTATTDSAGNPIAPKLLLYRSSYTFPPVKKTDEYVYVMAVPISKQYGNVVVCTTPTEVRVKVLNHAPSMTDGFTEITSYPEAMTDVPLRIGLDQLRAVSTKVAEAKDFGHHLTMPVKNVHPVTEGATDMQAAMDDNVYLTATNDPAYKNLQATSSDASSNGLLPIGLLPIGLLQGITATKDGGDANQFDLVFYSDQQFEFHEGYYYSMKFGFEEVVKAMGQTPCAGELVFTLKVVPKYQKWIGQENANWNNDANWARVTSSDLYRTGDVRQDPYVTDGANANTTSYVPLDFTHSIIDTASAPRLYGMATSPIVFHDGITYQWPSSPDQDSTGQVQPNKPTGGIQYDMVAQNAASGHVTCRPWYANTCKEINFRPGTEMLGQQHLAYEKAWVECSLAPGKWYTLGSPLKSVVAGDMYLPTGGARQETELFQPITFSTTGYNRFSPAVYQRAWNKAQATVYEMGGGSRNVAVRTAWSHVYNDVDEDYSHGEGFSIKVDTSRQTAPVERALLRLPKDDAQYEYYSDNAASPVVGNATPIDRKGTAYRLNDIEGQLTAQSAGASRYFLIGNPFMAHLDMQKFLQANSALVTPKYWILTNGQQNAAVMDPASGVFVGNLGEAGYVAPMQSFFVEAHAEASSLTLRYTADMTAVDVQGTPEFGINGYALDHGEAVATRGAEAGSALRITALVDGQPASQALVSLRQDAHAGYDEAEDVLLIDDEVLGCQPKVYTVTDNKAVDINALPRIDSTEVGVLAQDSAQVTLRFTGVDEADGLLLCDRLSGQSTPLTDGLSCTVKGSTAGRFCLRRASQVQEAAAGISITAVGNVLCVADGRGTSLEVEVYATDGVRVNSLASPTGSVRCRLTRGVYVVEAKGVDDRLTRTIVIP